MSTNSGGRGPLRVGISPVSACSMLARLIMEVLFNLVDVGGRSY